MGTVVGIDVGTSAVKAIAVGEDGTVLERREISYPLSTPRPGWSEQNPEDWWRATEQALDGLVDGEISGIGLSGQMHGLVTLDASDAVIRPAILWNDQRTQAECDEIEALVGLDRLIELTGNRALTGFTAPKLLWLRKHEPEAYARIAHVLLPKDYVRLRLTGERAIDVADASGTLLLDVARRRWSTEVVSALELDPEWLPRVLESPFVSGETSGGVPVAAGAGDQAAGALGVGVDRPGPLSVVLGTSGVVFAALPEYAADPQARVHAFCHAVPDTWHQMGVMLSAAGSLAWLRGVVGGEFGALVEEAAAWEPGVEGLTFLPYLTGERTPHADASARGSFTGLSVRPRPRRAGPRRAGGRRLRAARLVRSGGRRLPGAGLRRGCALGPLAADRRLGARAAARARRGGGGCRVRRRAARRGGRRRVERRRRGGRGLRAHARARRAGRGVDRALPGAPPPV
jgi:xylulokinase